MIAGSDVTFLVDVRSSDMRQTLALAVVSAAAVLGAPSLAGAELVAPPSKLPIEMAWPLAAGPGGSALAIVPTYCTGCNDGRVAERDASGRWTLRTIAPRGMFPDFVASGPGGAATVIAIGNASGGTGAFVLRRPAGAERFDAPVPMALGGQIYSAPRTVSDARGDIAFLTDVKGPDSVVRTILVAAARQGAFGAPQELAGPTETTAVAVGGGRVVIAYTNRRGVYARTGTIGAPLGAPQLLATRSVGEPGVGIDDAGDATVAFDQRGKTSFDHALMAARARPGERFGAPTVLGRAQAEFGFSAHGAAAGTTMALTWQRPFSDDSRVRVSVARGAGRFGRSETMPASNRDQPYRPVAAVSPAGDVLLAYAYGYDGAVHAAMRRAGSPRFGPLHVISKLGEGGAPSVAWLSDGRPLVVYHSRGGGLLATTHLTGPAPDLTPPRVDIKLSSDTLDELRATNVITVTVRCTEPCMLRTRASLRTHDGRTVADGVSRKLLGRRATFTERFAFDTGKRAGRAGDGSRVRVTVDAQNASGASSEAVKQIEL
jgi:hypothetical protein